MADRKKQNQSPRVARGGGIEFFSSKSQSGIENFSVREWIVVTYFFFVLQSPRVALCGIEFLFKLRECHVVTTPN